jgi:hypothetical protein
MTETYQTLRLSRSCIGIMLHNAAIMAVLLLIIGAKLIGSRLTVF